MVSEKTLYNLLNAGAFSATKLDCPRIVRMRPRQKTPAPKVDRHCYDGRTYDDLYGLWRNIQTLQLSDGFCNWS